MAKFLSCLLYILPPPTTDTDIHTDTDIYTQRSEIYTQSYTQTQILRHTEAQIHRQTHAGLLGPKNELS